MLLFANILATVLICISLGLDPIASTMVGFFGYFLLNLIPHWIPEKKDLRTNKIIKILDYVFSLLFLSFLSIMLFQKNFEMNITLNTNVITFNISSLLAAVVSFITYTFFYLLENIDIKSSFLKKLLEIKNSIEYKDLSFWGVFIHIAIIILSISLLFRLIDLPSWQKVIMELSK